jgi:hypothetical protein
LQVQHLPNADCSGQIRLYFADKSNFLTEIHEINEGKWTRGELTEESLFVVKEGSSISATVTRVFDDKKQKFLPTGLKVYATTKVDTKKRSLPDISLFRLEFGGKWHLPIAVTSEVKSYEPWRKVGS